MGITARPGAGPDAAGHDARDQAGRDGAEMSATSWVILMLTIVAIQYGVAAGAYQFSGRPGMAI